ncbi:hypothetical protein FACS1894216_07450 [Synergistales bacterium]|nr:hypothetical protein FACS1894216_07450 [Synergistales bacterium]
MLCVAALFLFFSFGRAPLMAAEVPAVDREAAESAYFNAYDALLQNRLWSCLDLLDKTLKEDTYFVDAYFLRSVALRRLGRYGEAIAAMSSYLEVRGNDARAAFLLRKMREEASLMRTTLHPDKLLYSTSFKRQTTGEFFNLPVYDQVAFRAMYGLGKINSWRQNLFICDTLGGRVWVRGGGERVTLSNIDVPLPVAVVPLSEGESYLFQKDGGVNKLKLTTVGGAASLRRVASLDVNIADAVVIDASVVAIADRTGRAVRFYSPPSFEETYSWSPPGAGRSEYIFEPAALAARGNMLAVADRGNGRVYVLNSSTLDIVDWFDVPLARDVEWGVQGELYALSEMGKLYRRYPIGASDAPPDLIADNMKNSWSVTWTEDGPVVSDITARAFWASDIEPAGDNIGSVMFSNPLIDNSNPDLGDVLNITGVVSTMFRGFTKGKTPDMSAIWRRNVLAARTVSMSEVPSGEAFYYSPYPAECEVNADVRYALSITDVIKDIAARSRGGGAMPGVIVMDTRITGSVQDADKLFALIFKHGIRLDLWAIGRSPSDTMEYLSRLSLGYIYRSAELAATPLGSRTEWVFGMVLPQDRTVSGYTSDATLSVISTADIIEFSDWLPIWPSMVLK